MLCISVGSVILSVSERCLSACILLSSRASPCFSGLSLPVCTIQGASRWCDYHKACYWNCFCMGASNENMQQILRCVSMNHLADFERRRLKTMWWVSRSRRICPWHLTLIRAGVKGNIFNWRDTRQNGNSVSPSSWLISSKLDRCPDFPFWMEVSKNNPLMFCKNDTIKPEREWHRITLHSVANMLWLRRSGNHVPIITSISGLWTKSDQVCTRRS